MFTIVVNGLAHVIQPGTAILVMNLQFYTGSTRLDFSVKEGTQVTLGCMVSRLTLVLVMCFNLCRNSVLKLFV